MKKIILTGGGTAGHVTPNLALLPYLRERDYEIRYIGSYTGMERELVERQGLAYDGISTGKLRRYFSIQNFSDPFRVLKGFFEALSLLRRHRPEVVFSKGGFVAVPVVLAAQLLHIPTIIHESDLTPGLANRLCFPGATRVCCNFPETLQTLPAKKAVYTGIPIRAELLCGSRSAGLSFAGFSGEKPVLMVVGGSSGSVRVNTAIRRILPALTERFDVVHLCGRGNVDETLTSTAGYVQFEYVSEELKDVLAAADLVISRAGANAICELLALKKPNLLIPLSKNASRGDQILNARSFEKQGFSAVIEEEEITEESLLSRIEKTWLERSAQLLAMEKSGVLDAALSVVTVIEDVRK